MALLALLPPPHSFPSDIAITRGMPVKRYAGLKKTGFDGRQQVKYRWHLQLALASRTARQHTVNKLQLGIHGKLKWQARCRYMIPNKNCKSMKPSQVVVAGRGVPLGN